MKTVWNIIWRTLLGVALAVYCLVALLNYSLVQSYAAAEVGRRLSAAWGGEVKIGSLKANPFDHLIAHNLLMVAPDGDTILDARTLRVRFKRFPYRGNRLELSSVYLRDAYYHLATWEVGDTTAPDYVCRSPLFVERPGTNLQHIIDYYYKGPIVRNDLLFTVDVGAVILRGVHYKMDLYNEKLIIEGEELKHGVEIPHMEFFDIHGKINDVHVVNDDVTCRLVKLKALERSGFRAKNIAARVHVSPQDITATDLLVETERSRIMADVEITYDGWESLIDYVNVAHHKIDLKEGSAVAVSDVAFWAPMLWGIDAQLMPDGQMSGTVNDMDIARLSLRFGHASEVFVSGEVSDLLDAEHLFVDLQTLDVRFEESDLTSLTAQMPRYITPQVAEYLRQIQYIDLTAQAVGHLNSTATANVNLVCGLGNLRADISSQPCRRGRHVVLNMGSDGMGLTPLGSDWLTHSGFDMNVEADLPKKGLTEWQTIRAEADMTLTGSVVSGNRLEPVTLHANMENGNLTLNGECNDSLADFTLYGRLKLADSIRGYHIDLQLNNLDPSLFAAGQMPISTHLVANFKGNDLDNLSGGALAYRTRVGDIRMREIRLNVNSDGGDKHLQLESDAVGATVSGRFAYADLPIMVQQICYQALPEDLGLIAAPDSATLASIAANTMNFNIRLNDNVSRFVPNSTFNIAGGTRVDGAYNSTEMLRLVARGDWVDFGTVHIGDFGVQTGMYNGRYNALVEGSSISVGDLGLMNDVWVTFTSGRDSSSLNLTWGDSTQNTFGDILLTLDSGDIRVEHPWFNVGKTQWQLSVDGMHIEAQPQPTFKGDLLLVNVDNTLKKETTSLSAKLRLLGQDNDCVELNFNNFGLALLSDILLQDAPVDVEGSLGGRFSLYGLASTPYFNANLTIDGTKLNTQELGTLNIVSTWNAEMNTLNLHLGGNTLNATGWVALGDAEPELSLAIDFNRFELATVAPLISEFSSRFEGQVEGQIDISGTLNSPIVLGEAHIAEGVLKVDITGVTYFFDDSISFYNNLVSLRDFRILDQQGNAATLDGEIRYSGLDNIDIDLSLSTDNLLVLNQRSGDDFYGTLLVGADGTVRGGTGGIDIGLRARTNQGSTLTVPITDRRQVRDQNYITFVGADEGQRATQSPTNTASPAVNIEMDLTITPDLQLNLPMRFSEVTVGVKGGGNGDLHLTLGESMVPEVQGAYEITSGSLRLGVASLIEKTFTLEPGSSLNFQGSLPDAQFDLQAVYSQRVNLSTLTGSLSAVDNTQKYIQVDDIIAIAGTLTDPTLRFDIRLPGADASVEEEVFSYIDRNSERDMLNQSMSLLLMGSFYNVGGSAGDNANLLSSGLTSGYSMVASTMGNIVSDMVQVVDVDFKYKAATELTNEQVDLNISKDWGRFYLESTLGYGGDSRELEDDMGGNAVIDALLGYRITPMVHVYAYNRTNNNDYTRLDLPYKQGAGIKLTKDFDRWSELIRRKKRVGE